MVHKDYKEMIPARALSALEAEENHALNEHLSSCSECRHELETWEATAAGLALAANPVEPSPAVRDRIMQQLRAESLPDHSSPSVSTEAARVLPFKPVRSTFWSSFGLLGAIAATIALAALLVSVFVLWRENLATRALLAQVSDQLKNTEAELDRSRQVVQFFSSPGATITELAGTDMAPGANAKLAYDKTGHAMLLAYGLPAPPQGKEYQLWFIVGSKAPMRGKTFAPDTSGKGILEDEVPSEALRAAVFAVTMEPRGGVEAPTGKIYLRSGS